MCNIWPRWGSSGQRSRLLLRRSDFESRSTDILNFSSKIAIKKGERKQKEVVIGPFKTCGTCPRYLHLFLWSLISFLSFDVLFYFIRVKTDVLYPKNDTDPRRIPRIES